MKFLLKENRPSPLELLGTIAVSITVGSLGQRREFVTLSTIVPAKMGKPSNGCKKNAANMALFALHANSFTSLCYVPNSKKSRQKTNNETNGKRWREFRRDSRSPPRLHMYVVVVGQTSDPIPILTTKDRLPFALPFAHLLTEFNGPRPLSSPSQNQTFDRIARIRPQNQHKLHYVVVKKQTITHTGGTKSLKETAAGATPDPSASIAKSTGDAVVLSTVFVVTSRFSVCSVLRTWSSTSLQTE